MKKLFFIFAIGVGVLGFAQKKNSQDWHKKEILEKDRFSKDFDRMINFEKGKFEKENNRKRQKKNGSGTF